ncbi:protein kinase, putative [Trypanosoma cruzi marinkellei]|uniref:Protein kinase, putative n=1 Tax=Trypanosoma cruzi marinkellei TaxID=85056 RepID=K2NRV0_TRYCR|nr:protein kinase, putative [Trypanosoma cruzi marinkellei]
MDRGRSEEEKPRVLSRASTQVSSVFGSSNPQFPMGLGVVEGTPDSERRNGVSGFQLKNNNCTIRPPTGNEEVQILSFSPTPSSPVSTRPCGTISSSKTTDGQASMNRASFLRQALFTSIRSSGEDRGIHLDAPSNEVLEKSKQKIADGDVMMSQSLSTSFSRSLRLPQAHRVDTSAIAVTSEFASPNSRRDESGIKKLLPNVKSSSEKSLLKSPVFRRFSLGENYTGSPYIRDEVDAAVPNATLRQYISSRPKPAVRGRGLYRRVYLTLISLVLLPFVFTALLFVLHYWASSHVAEKLYHYEGARMSDNSFCDRNFLELQYRQIGPISKECFICVMGILLALIIFVIGGSFVLWTVPWRCVFLNYLQTLEFIRRAAPTLAQIKSLGPEQLAKAPKPVPSFFFWHWNRGKNNNKELLSQGIVGKVVLLGITLNELKKYIPSTVQNDVILAVLTSHRRDSLNAVSTTERQGDRISGPSPPHEEIVVTTGELNPLQINAQAHSPLSVRKEAANFTGELCRSYGSGSYFDYTQKASQRRNSNKLSPSHRRLKCPAGSLSGLILSRSTSVTLTAENERALQLAGNRGECTVSEAAETRITMLNDYGFSLQQTIFMVCRLFLPKLELDSDASVTRDSVNKVREMSQRFLRIVLRVAKEENGFSFNICLDSVIIVFYTPSGTNCINLFQPRNCALRLVSELSKLESDWASASSTPLTWGIAMHMSLLMIGVNDMGSRRFAYLYGEELQFAYRVAELCMILHCPLIMLQSCYDLFRVCMMAVPVDVIYRETIRGKDRIYLYEPKMPEEGEDIDTKREYYKPLTVAFGLMCGGQFADAAQKLAGIVEMDHNVSRLHRLCEYFLRMQEKGTINTILSHTENYVREEPRWEPLESKAAKFLDKYRLQEKQPCIHRCREFYRNNESNEENATRDHHAAFFLRMGTK